MAATVRELDSQPRLPVLYTKAVYGAGRSALSMIPGVPSGDADPALPEAELRLSAVEVDRGRLAEYDRVCGFRLRDTLPPTYPHILAFPLSMELMTSGEFPFPVIGMVHVGNRIEQRRPIGAGEPLDLRVWADDLRPHERGLQFEMRAEASVAGEPVWSSSSTYLRRGGGGGGDGKRPPAHGKRRAGETRAEPPRAQAQWQVPGDIGRSYAGVSGDSNPIHMHSLSARLFGMPRAIAHGMWLKARCLAALEGHLGDAFEAEVSFKLPVPIPGGVSFASWPDGEGRGFALRDAKNERPHLAGSLRPA